MNTLQLSRRNVLQTLGGALLAAATPLGCRTAVEEDQTEADDKRAPETIIDVHMHLVKTRLPGVPEKALPLAPFDKDDRDGPKKLAKAVQDEAKKAGVTQALCMPRFEVSDDDPLGVKDTLALADLVQGVKLHAVGLANPERFGRVHLERVEEVLKQKKVKALKAYLGYLYYEPYSPGYRFYFPLAAKYNIPVIFHCGDTYSPLGKVKYAHPLKLDEVAVDYPETNFVIAHFGNPWLMDAAQVAYKNKNVWVDLSAIVIGNAAAFARMEKEGVLERTAKRIKEAIEYTEAPERFLFGSDWPLSPLVEYRDFVRRLFPQDQHASVLAESARKLFGL